MARSRRRLVVGLLLGAVLVLGSARAARAADGADAESPSGWYGWQTLIVDGASILTAPVGLGVAGYGLGAPIVHAAHGRWPIGLASLGLRVAAPAFGAFAGAALLCQGSCRGANRDGGGFGPLIGAGAFAAGAIALDASVLAREDGAAEALARRDDGVAAQIRRQVAAPRTPTIQPTLSPRLSPRHELEGVDVGVGGIF